MPGSTGACPAGLKSPLRSRAVAGMATGVRHMAKSQDAHKEDRKKPAKTLKEKKAAKIEKKRLMGLSQGT
jgi:hypothetical protein